MNWSNLISSNRPFIHVRVGGGRESCRRRRRLQTHARGDSQISHRPRTGVHASKVRTKMHLVSNMSLLPNGRSVAMHERPVGIFGKVVAYCIVSEEQGRK